MVLSCELLTVSSGNMETAKYTQGSIARHLVVMAASTAAGLMVMFFSDLVDMYFLSLLGEVEIAAAVGFAGSVLFFTISMSIGLSIACTALVSTSLGTGDTEDSRQSVTCSWVSTFLIMLPITVLVWFSIPFLLEQLGAQGRALHLACQYLQIIIPSMPLLAIAMSAGAVMRSRGDAKNAMWLTMLGGIANAILDPIFIFGFDLGVQGAAIATLLSRICMLAFGLYIVVYRNRLLGRFDLASYKEKFVTYNKVALPAVLTNLSTPIGIAYVTYVMAQFGDSAVAGNAIISRIQPVAFAGLFGLSAVVGPIAGQNFGAKNMGRVYSTLWESIRLVVFYCVVVSTLLWLLKPIIVPLFNASDEANELVYLFCNGLSLMFIFNGLTFVTNALFNNLGVAHYSTVMNLLKSTVGTIPFVMVGAWWGGPQGAFWGLFAGSVVMGLAGLAVAVRVFKKIDRQMNAR